MRIILFIVLVVMMGGAIGATMYVEHVFAQSAACPQGWTLVDYACLNPPDLRPPSNLPPMLPSSGPFPIVTTAERAAELMAEYRLKVLTWDATVDVIDEELLLAADLKWWECSVEYEDDPLLLIWDVCQQDWYANTEYFEHNYDIEPPWLRD